MELPKYHALSHAGEVPATARTQLRRLPDRGSYDAPAIHRILDSAFLAHVGFCVDGQPFVIPTLYGRLGNTLYLHGSAASRMMRELERGVPACVTVTLVDGIVLARSAFHHSMNYRSVVAFGMARKIVDPAAKSNALRVISEHVVRGRWEDVRGPSEKELKATTVLEFAIEEASAKTRSGPPKDDAEDLALPVWAGVIPFESVAHWPVPDSGSEATPIPGYLRRFNSSSTTKNDQGYQVFELRRYTIRESERDRFAECFDAYFPEVFQQLGAMVFGQFLDRDDPSGFTWIRGCHNMPERAAMMTEFYEGPVWKEHSAAANEPLMDFTNVLLLRPLSPERSLTLLPAVEAAARPSAAPGVVVACIFAVQPGQVDAFVKQVESTFDAFRDTGAREAGVLVTLDAPNNYPRHPIREDGPYLVWIGVLEDDTALHRFKAVADTSLQSLAATGLLRGTPEQLVLDPSRRSRLRWRS